MFKRAGDRARELAGGAAVPAGRDTSTPQTPLARRGRPAARRRIRRLRNLREARLRDLGLLVLELERRGRQNPELMSRRIAQLRALDDQLVELATALGRRGELDQVVLAGIAGYCSACGSLVGVDDHYCANCGTSSAGPPPVATTAPPAAPPSEQ